MRQKTLAHVPVKSVEIAAVVIRADGRREELGVVSYWHRNPLVRAQRAIGKHLGEIACALKALWRRLR